MTKKVLMLAAKANMIQQFNHRNIKILQDLGYEVHVATNMVDFGSMSAEENERFKQWMNDNKVVAHQVDFERRMGSLKGNISSIKQLRKVFEENNFSFIHTHSPLGSILGRLVARKFKIPTIYTAHGFHFFKGGPKSGWVVFYPLEWFFSFITDTLITINDEDYELAEKHMHAKNIIKINGIGVDVEKSWRVTDEEKMAARKKIRKELNISDDAFVMSSVGELSDRKNHRIVLEALSLLSPNELKKMHYVVAGTGDNEELLRETARSFGFEKHLHLLGYRSDIHSINYASNLFIFPSLREGLGIAGLDATIDGTYVFGTEKGGVSDYIEEGINGNLFNPTNSAQLAKLIYDYFKNPIRPLQVHSLHSFSIETVDNTMMKVYMRDRL